MIATKEKGCIILVNKWDLQKDESTQRKYGEELNISLPFLSHVPIVFCSAETGYNIRKSIETIDYVAKQVSTQMGTGVLNRVLENAFNKTQPPMVNGKRLKVYYATQLGTRPIRIKLFVNNPQLATPAWSEFGGPHGDFSVEQEIAWPASGPRLPPTRSPETCPRRESRPKNTGVAAEPALNFLY